MGAEYINPQWRLPNEKTGNNQGYSMNFNGSQKITLNSSIQLTTNKSISVWCYVKPTVNQNTLLGGDAFPDYWFWLDNPNSKVYIRDSSNITQLSTGTLSEGWTHFCITGDGTTATLYVNGVATDTGTDRELDIRAIGGYVTGSTYFFNGKSDGVAIFDYALPATGSNSITTLYNSGTPFNPMALASPPIAYYPLGNSAHMGSNYLTPNGALQDYVFDFIPNDHIDTNFTLPNYSDYSYSFWIKNTGNTSGSDQWILGNSSASVSGDTGSRGAVRINNSTKIRIFGGDDTNYYRKQYNFTAGNAQGNTTIFDGKWYNIVITFTSGTIVFYVNGISQTHESTGTTGSPITGFAANNSYRIGQSGTNTGYLNYSELSNVQIFNTVLSQSDAETLYNYGSPIQTLANIPQSSNLKAWYKLDASEIYNNSTTKWEINQASSFWKNSVDFNLPNVNGNLAYIECANTTNLNLTGAMTISAWMKGAAVDNAGGNAGGIGTTGGTNNRGYSLLRTTNNRASFGIASLPNSTHGATSPTNSWKENEWNHVVGVFDPSSRLEVYLNGEFAASASAPSQQRSNYSFKIGQRGDASPYYAYNWLGQLSNVSIWNTALSNGGASVGSVAGGEIATLYNSGEPLQDLLTGPQNSNLLSWWKLDNITTGIQDSKNANNGTIVTTGSGLVSKFDQSVSTLNGLSSGMNQSNLVQSDLLTTSSYSPYALNFDGNDIIDCGSDSSLTPTTAFSVSCWVYLNATGTQSALHNGSGNNDGYILYFMGSYLRFYIREGSSWRYFDSDNAFVANTWYNVTATWGGSTMKMYINNALQSNTATASSININTRFRMGAYGGAASLNGRLSNVSVWNSELTSSQVTEIYNEGRPSNLHTFSGTAPVAWWQLGSNSSWTSPSWTILDEIGTNNGTSTSMLENAITDGVGTSGNGTSTNMTTATNISGSSPNGEGNSLSVNMTLANLAAGVV